MPEYLSAARVADPDRAGACQAVMPALWAWCEQPEDSAPFDRSLAEAFWCLSQDEDEEAWVPELGGFGDEAFEVISAACGAPLEPRSRDTASSEAFEFVQLRRAEPVTRAAFQRVQPIGEAIRALYDASHFRMAEIAVQEAALRLAEQRQAALTKQDAWSLEARSGELLAANGPELLDLYREFLEARVDVYTDHWNPEVRRGAVVLLVECANHASGPARERFLDRAREQAIRLGADDLDAYVRAQD